jgi:hypothetical protein
MPILAAAGVLLLVVLAIIVLMPISLVQRYRVGTARRLARGWVASLNLAALAVSIVLFLAGAGITSYWVPGALKSALAGLAAGALLGILGLWVSRWEAGPASLHYTPNRWLVLGVTLIVSARLVYGFWRGWDTWRAGSGDPSWLAAAGVAGSLAAGAIVLGYYATYWFGVRVRIRRHERARRVLR